MAPAKFLLFAVLALAATAPAASAGVVAFSSNRCGEGAPQDTCQTRIWRVADDGSGLKQLTGLGDSPSHSWYDSNPTWSADGRWILYLTRRPGSDGVGDPLQLAAVSADGSAQMPLGPEFPPSAGSWISDPDLSPVGTHAVVTRWVDEGRSSDLALIPLAGEPLVPLTNTRAWEASPVFSPDGRHLAFVRGRGVPNAMGFPTLTPDSGFYVRDLVSGEELPLMLGDPPETLVPGSFALSFADLAYSPDGQALAFTWMGRIYTIASDGKDVSLRSTAAQGNGNTQVTWSNVGPSLIFSQPRTPTPLQRLNLSSGSVEPLTPAPDDPVAHQNFYGDQDPDWSDGSSTPPKDDLMPPAVEFIRPPGPIPARGGLPLTALDVSGIRRLDVALALRRRKGQGARCSFVRPRGRARPARCDRPRFVRIRRASEWLKLVARVRPGRYQLRYRATDGEGNTSRSRSALRFTVARNGAS